MFELHCDELIRALAKRADGLRTKLLQRMSKEHQLLNKRYTIYTTDHTLHEYYYVTFSETQRFQSHCGEITS